MSIKSFTETAVYNVSPYHFEKNDSLTTKAGKLLAGRVVYGTIGLAAIIEIIAFAALAALISPTYICTSKPLCILSGYTRSSRRAAHESARGFVGLGKTIERIDSNQFIAKQVPQKKEKTMQDKALELLAKFWANPKPALEVIATFTVLATLYYYFRSSASVEPICPLSETPFEDPTNSLPPKRLFPFISISAPLVPPPGTTSVLPVTNPIKI